MNPMYVTVWEFFSYIKKLPWAILKKNTQFYFDLGVFAVVSRLTNLGRKSFVLKRVLMLLPFCWLRQVLQLHILIFILLHYQCNAFKLFQLLTGPFSIQEQVQLKPTLLDVNLWISGKRRVLWVHAPVIQILVMHLVRFLVLEASWQTINHGFLIKLPPQMLLQSPRQEVR